MTVAWAANCPIVPLSPVVCPSHLSAVAPRVRSLFPGQPADGNDERCRQREYEFGKRKAGEPGGDAQGEDRARRAHGHAVQNSERHDEVVRLVGRNPALRLPRGS
jgi:hypothetical protein